MALHKITSTVSQTPLGAANNNAGIPIILCKAVAVGSTFSLNTAYLLSQPSDLTALGITEIYDATNGVAVYQQITEFYLEAGTGAKCWLVGVAVGTAYATYVATSTFAGLIRNTTQGDATLRAKAVGLCFDLPTATQTSTDFKQDVLDTITALYTIQQSMFQEHYEWYGVIDGTQMNATASYWTSLVSLALRNKPTIGVAISGYKPWGIASVGALLGRAARISVGTSIGQVQNNQNADDPVLSNTGYLTNGYVTKLISSGTLINLTTYLVAGADDVVYNGVTYSRGQTFQCTTAYGTAFTTASGLGYVIATGAAPKDVLKMIDNPDFQSLGTGQFLFLRTWFGKSGIWWNDGSTAAATTNPLCTIENNRVVNDLDADLVAFLINLMNKKVPVDTKTGAIDNGFLKAKETDFYNTYIAPLLPDSGSGDISGATITFTGAKFNANKTIYYTLVYVAETPLGQATGTIQNAVSL